MNKISSTHKQVYESKINQCQCDLNYFHYSYISQMLKLTMSAMKSTDAQPDARLIEEIRVL